MYKNDADCYLSTGCSFDPCGSGLSVLADVTVQPLHVVETAILSKELYH